MISDKLLAKMIKSQTYQKQTWDIHYLGAPTGARVPFVRVPSYQREFARVERCPGGKLSGAIFPGANIIR